MDFSYSWAWLSSINIHRSRCCHKGNDGNIFLWIFGPYKLLLFQFGPNLWEENKKGEPGKLNPCRFLLSTFPFSPTLFLTTFLSI